jgi:hypothetical protein
MVNLEKISEPDECVFYKAAYQVDCGGKQEAVSDGPC